jgi:hypothetical protein
MGRLAAGACAAVLIGVILVFTLGRTPAKRDSLRHSEVRSFVREVPSSPVSSEPHDKPPHAPLERAKTGAALPPFASEDDYLRALDQLNGIDKRRALQLVQKGDEWYSSSGVKAEARKAMGITLLVDLGEMDEARARTRRFIAEHPKSVYRPLVQGVTGIHPRPSGPGQELRKPGTARRIPSTSATTSPAP